MTDLRLDTRTQFRPRSSGKPATSPASPVVFVVDDDLSVRDSLELLAGWAGWQVETFASASGFLARPRASVPSCLVLDAGLSDVTGLDMQQRLADRPEMPIIFISGSGDVRTAVRAMKAGAVEFLTKPLADELLLARCATPSSAAAPRSFAKPSSEALRLRYASLTCRERDVMALIVCGRLNKQAGADPASARSPSRRTAAR